MWNKENIDAEHFRYTDRCVQEKHKEYAPLRQATGRPRKTVSAPLSVSDVARAYKDQLDKTEVVRLLPKLEKTTGLKASRW
ncbi:MAG: hypothetical protein LBP35_02700 [Candidatus Ancillula trichonymphae]|nr:hypothetical protein [Candidatus Ancillula trichonymphae]